MSGVGIKVRPSADSDVMCLLQCAHPPGKPLQLWYCELPLSEMLAAQDNDAVSEMWDVLLNEDPKGRKK